MLRNANCCEHNQFLYFREPNYSGKDDKILEFWDPVNPRRLQFLNWGEEIKMVDNPYENATNFWESLNLPDTTPARLKP